MAGFSVCRTAMRIMVFVTAVLVVSTIFQYPFPTGLNALGVDDMSDNDSNFMISNRLLEVEDSSWMRPGGKRVTSRGLIDEKILMFVARIVELEKSLVSAQHGALSNQQMCQIKQMMSHLKLVKTLFERSVFLTKLADLASHRTDSSPWIAWDQLEPATKELEESIKTLNVQDDKNHPVYICFKKESIIAASIVVMTISCLLLAQKVVKWVRRR